MTADGLFGAGDTIGGTARKFSSGSFTEGWIAATAAVKCAKGLGQTQPQIGEREYRDREKTIFQPLDTAGQCACPPDFAATARIPRQSGPILCG